MPFPAPLVATFLQSSLGGRSWDFESLGLHFQVVRPAPIIKIQLSNEMGIPASHLQMPMLQLFEWKSVSESTGDKLRVMSWNILAERLVSQEFFPYVKPEYLSYDYRIDIIKRFLFYNDCEILCLQEVDSANSFFSFLEDMGYSYIYKPKGPLHGILIAYKKDLFKVLDEKSVDYDTLITPPFKKQVYSTGHGAIMLKLLYKGIYKLVVANTHLFWVPRFERVKYHQVCSVLSEMKKFTEDDPDCHKFLLGDFNSTPTGNCVNLITQNASPDYDVCFEPRWNYSEMVTKYEQNEDKLIEMKSVFQPEYGRFTNLTNKFRGMIDYIFYQERDNLEINQVLKLPGEQELRKETAIPNSIIPSDHLPLVCQFRLKNPQG